MTKPTQDKETLREAVAASQSNPSVSSTAGIANALDICACGHERREHPNDGPCSHGDYHKPLQCVQFRLSATSLQILEGMEEWARICESAAPQGFAETLGRIAGRVEHWQAEEREKTAALAWCRANGNPHKEQSND